MTDESVFAGVPRHNFKTMIMPEQKLRTTPMRRNAAGQFVGILLAAGRGLRFEPTGTQNKLMQPLPNGDTVAVAAARNLLAALPMVLAVVRPGADALAAQLRAIGCEVIECPSAELAVCRT